MDRHDPPVASTVPRGRTVALEMVRAVGGHGLPDERLLREAEAAARLSHPNIVALAACAGVLAIFLAVDVVDAAGAFTGPNWVAVALQLHANKAVVVAHQISPAALLLGTVIAVSDPRRTRVWTALRSVGLGPWRVALPVVGAVTVAALAQVALHEAWGVEAAHWAEEIHATHFAGEDTVPRWKATR